MTTERRDLGTSARNGDLRRPSTRTAPPHRNGHTRTRASSGRGRARARPPTFLSGFSLVSMMNSYLQSSQQRVSELLIHCCRQAWCTKCRLPVQWQGVIRGLSSSPSQWQILGRRKESRALPAGLTTGCQGHSPKKTLRNKHHRINYKHRHRQTKARTMTAN